MSRRSRSTSAIGYHTTISAPAQITRGGKTWTFAGWSDGGARAHDITIPATASTRDGDVQAAADP